VCGVRRTRAGEPDCGDEHSSSVGRHQVRRRYVREAEPICEACAHQLLQRFESEQLPIPSVVRERDYFERAYHQGPDEQDL
jgi:hypothetical protein